MKVKTYENVLFKALEETNKIFRDNVVMESVFVENCKDGRCWFKVRLKTKKIGPGARKGFSRKYVKYGCWHAYGEFLDKVFEYDEGAVVYTRGKRYTKSNWLWEDWLVGSLINPYYYSELCYCADFDVY